jgi:uncharacterized protein with HEPN domain
LADEKTRYAVMRAAYEILGEAVRYIPDPIQQVHADTRWRTMASVLNRIAHGYFEIDDTILFTTIEGDIKPPLSRLEALARSLGVPE